MDLQRSRVTTMIPRKTFRIRPEKMTVISLVVFFRFFPHPFPHSTRRKYDKRYDCRGRNTRGKVPPLQPPHTIPITLSCLSRATLFPGRFYFSRFYSTSRIKALRLFFLHLTRFYVSRMSVRVPYPRRDSDCTSVFCSLNRDNNASN